MSSVIWVDSDEDVFVKASAVVDGDERVRGDTAPDPARKYRIMSTNEVFEYSSKKTMHYDVSHDSCSPDLAFVDAINDAAVLNTVQQRYAKGQIYTRLGPLVISLNPFCSIDGLHDMDAFHHKLITNVRNRDEDAHIFSVAYGALQQAKVKSQTIIVRGETGSGKSDVCSRMVEFVLHDPSSTGSHSTPSTAVPHSVEFSLEDEILACRPILESFGNAGTLKNGNSSRFVKYVKLYVQQNHKESYMHTPDAGVVAGSIIVGADITQCLLEKSRVVDQRQDERSFHIFYQILLGMDKENLTTLGLHASQHYRFLCDGVVQQDKFSSSNASSLSLKNHRDVEKFSELKVALTKVGIESDQQMEIFHIVAAILHLGNVSFKTPVGDAENVVCEIVGTNHYKFVEHVLKIESLKTQLTTKLFSGAEGRASTYVVELTADQCTHTTAIIAKDLYDRLFHWLVQKCNEVVKCDTTSTNYVGILDIFGFEVIINYALMFCHCNGSSNNMIICL